MKRAERSSGNSEVNGLKGKENSVGSIGYSKTEKVLSKITNKIRLLQVLV